jgi:hypothetical protein
MPPKQFLDQQNTTTSTHLKRIEIWDKMQRYIPMQQNPSWKAGSRWAVQIIPNHICSLKVHYSVQKTRQLVSPPSHKNLVDIFKTDFFQIHCNIIINSTARFTKYKLSSVFWPKFRVHFYVFHEYYILRWFYHSNNIFHTVQIMMLLLYNIPIEILTTTTVRTSKM